MLLHACATTPIWGAECYFELLRPIVVLPAPYHPGLMPIGSPPSCGFPLSRQNEQIIAEFAHKIPQLPAGWPDLSLPWQPHTSDGTQRIAAAASSPPLFFPLCNEMERLTQTGGYIKYAERKRPRKNAMSALRGSDSPPLPPAVVICPPRLRLLTSCTSVVVIRM